MKTIVNEKEGTKIEIKKQGEKYSYTYYGLCGNNWAVLWSDMNLSKETIEKEFNIKL